MWSTRRPLAALMKRAAGVAGGLIGRKVCVCWRAKTAPETSNAAAAASKRKRHYNSYAGRTRGPTHAAAHAAQCVRDGIACHRLQTVHTALLAIEPSRPDIARSPELAWKVLTPSGSRAAASQAGLTLAVGPRANDARPLEGWQSGPGAPLALANSASRTPPAAWPWPASEHVRAARSSHRACPCIRAAENHVARLALLK